MKTLLTIILFFSVSCNTPEKKETQPKTQQNRYGAVLMSVYKIEKNYWYVILGYNSDGTYYYYHTSTKPVSDFLNVKWHKTNNLPVELVIAEPEDVFDVSLSDLPLDVESQVDTTLK